eukprot:1405134-Pyramimonas_sp.AAC.1
MKQKGPLRTIITQEDGSNIPWARTPTPSPGAWSNECLYHVQVRQQIVLLECIWEAPITIFKTSWPWEAGGAFEGLADAAVDAHETGLDPAAPSRSSLRASAAVVSAPVEAAMARPALHSTF